MGKVAENEKIKLRATMANNTAVGLLIAAVFAPLFAVFPNIADLPNMSEFTLRHIFIVFASFAGWGAAIWGAWSLYAYALKEVEKLEDQ
jgi:hypothetical protein